APRRIWTRAYFDERVRAQCLSGARFALARVTVQDVEQIASAGEILANALEPAGIISAAETGAYDLLFPGPRVEATRARTQDIMSSLARHDVKARLRLAFCPDDGAQPSALIARLTDEVSGEPGGAEAATEFIVHDQKMAEVYGMVDRIAPSDISIV